jgi:hypothetical protein
MGAFERSWEITKLSVDVMRKDKELLAFPIIAGLFSIAFIAAMLFPFIAAVFASAFTKSPMIGIVFYIMLFLTYLGLALIATFFNTCVVYTTKKRFEGGNATFWESIRFSFSRFHLILLWSLTSATVGIILKIIERASERSGPLGRIIAGLVSSVLGLAWRIVIIFVIPGMVYKSLGPFAAIKKSAETIKKTWGESLIRAIGLGLAQGLFFFVGAIITAVLVFAAISISPYAILAVAVLAVLYFVAISTVFFVANSIFNTALFVYADTGKVPQGYSKEMMDGAFKKK